MRIAVLGSGYVGADDRGADHGQNAYDVASDADAVVVVTEWSEFRSLDLDRLGATMKARVLVDLRNIYSADQARRHNFTYVSIGRPDGVSDGHMLQAAE